MGYLENSPVYSPVYLPVPGEKTGGKTVTELQSIVEAPGPIYGPGPGTVKSQNEH